ncbi:MAG: hypothetical protein JO307_17815 [Bryobacterales bacterium]|nr:hypothetical protein [Bryobacterales bacterium]
MRLIHTCELAGANAFDYLSQFQRHGAELMANPGVDALELPAAGGLKPSSAARQKLDPAECQFNGLPAGCNFHLRSARAATIEIETHTGLQAHSSCFPPTKLDWVERLSIFSKFGSSSQAELWWRAHD